MPAPRFVCFADSPLKLLEWICRHAVCAALLALALAAPASAEKGKLRERLTPDVMAAVYPGAARLGRRARAPQAAVTVPTRDLGGFQLMSWNELVAEGAVARRRVTAGEVADALAKAGVSDAALEVPLGKPDDLYIEVMTGLLTP